MVQLLDFCGDSPVAVDAGAVDLLSAQVRRQEIRSPLRLDENQHFAALCGSIIFNGYILMDIIF